MSEEATREKEFEELLRYVRTKSPGVAQDIRNYVAHVREESRKEGFEAARKEESVIKERFPYGKSYSERIKYPDYEAWKLARGK